MADGIDINVSIETDMLGRLATGLSSREVAKATARAINYAINKSRTRMKRAVTDEYKIPSKQVTESTLKAKGANTANLTGYIFGNASPESLGHFNPTQFKDVLGGRRGGGHIKVSKRGAGYTSTKKDRNTSRSGVYVEVVKGHKERITSAFLIFRGTKPLVMARGQYAGSAGFIRMQGGRLPIEKLNTKSIYWGVLHPKSLSKWDKQTETDYNAELLRQLNGAVMFG